MPFPVELVTFTEEILNGKLHFLCSEMLIRMLFTTIIFTGKQSVGVLESLFNKLTGLKRDSDTGVFL